MLLLFFFPISDVHQIGESALIGPRVKEYLADASTPSVRGVWPAKMDPRGSKRAGGRCRAAPFRWRLRVSPKPRIFCGPCLMSMVL